MVHLVQKQEANMVLNEEKEQGNKKEKLKCRIITFDGENSKKVEL